MSEFVSEVIVMPDGMEVDDPNLAYFSLKVRWRGASTDTGRGGYAVIHGGYHLSRAGKWRYEPGPFLQRHHRWDDIELALTAARDAVNEVSVNGITWREWSERNPQIGGN